VLFAQALFLITPSSLSAAILRSPGNVLVRKSSSGPQLILLDHGLYRQLDSKLRLEYCELWRAIVLSDTTGIKRSASRLGIKSKWMDRKFPGSDFSHTIVAAMLTAREWETVAKSSDLGRFDAFRAKAKKEQRESLSKNVSSYLGAIVDVLETCPRDLLLILKANDALRSASNNLGARSVDNFLVTALTCLRVLLTESSVSKFKSESDSASKRNRRSSEDTLDDCTSWFRRARRTWNLVIAFARVKFYIFWVDTFSAAP
jgi:hypothetical protein